MEQTLFPVLWPTQAAISGRVRDKESKKVVAQQLANVNKAVPEFDLKTGQIKSKKVPKEKTPQQLACKDLKDLEKKTLT